MSRIFRYILDSDGGMAPCPQDGTVTLGTCKPGIRKSAAVGDWVAGFMPGSLNRGDMVWAGQVAEKHSHDDYRKRFPKRRDAIYAMQDDGIYSSHLSGYHCDPADQRRDCGSPVLIFATDRSWYFGDAPQSLPSTLMHLAAKGRGYRVNFREDGDLKLWIAWLSEHAPGVHGKPRDELNLCPGCLLCADSEAKPRQRCGKGKAKPKRPNRC